ncbi:PREDICTED: glyoxylate/hydroxypyruvate reductase HPR3-like isoform X2 [Lupinus angustifolius]|uniref:glyoxylate/hydroxypyruvate reductase HPR3-like isoform X2 n=2 Tax=Lupinus angustifolius TaxID=3871 RepID=UPI00092EE795|nr:PREDICTED: glyoxylate/hydroxypyruvate reductase HPR3-like isoform X2 [Lupinus angustifolius]
MSCNFLVSSCADLGSYTCNSFCQTSSLLGMDQIRVQSSMAVADEHYQDDNKELQPLLVFGPPLIFEVFESRNSHKYLFLKAFSIQLPLLEFLTTQNVDPSSIRTILCNQLQPITANVIRLLPSLALIVTTTIGNDHIDLPECNRRGVQVVNVGSQSTEDVADMAVGLLIDVLYRISAADRYVRKWVPSKPWNLPPGSKLGGKRVGIVGLGRIGGEVAKRLEAFNCRIMYHSRHKKPFVSYTFYSNILELASNSDVLVLCCSLTDETRHMINREVMLALGKEGVIVNVGRGALIDENALVQCLMKGEIRGAGLDVFENEPEVPKELITLDNVVLSPHAAALTSDYFTDTCKFVAESLSKSLLF